VDLVAALEIDLEEEVEWAERAAVEMIAADQAKVVAAMAVMVVVVEKAVVAVEKVVVEEEVEWVKWAVWVRWAAVEMIAAADQAKITAGQKVVACMDRITASSRVDSRVDKMTATSVDRTKGTTTVDKSRATEIAELLSKSPLFLFVIFHLCL
jgi:hypothetical protein